MKKKIILLADDDIDDRDMFCESLAAIDENIDCNCSGNGSELLEKLNELEEEPKLIFLDLNMPVMNGWECLQLLKEDKRYRHIPVIMISTSSHTKEMDTALELGALCYFVKPNNFNQLKQFLEVITSSLENGLEEALSKLKAEGNKHVFCRGKG